MRLFLSLVTFALTTVLSLEASAADIHVAAGGTGDGKTAATPLGTIAGALAGAQPGDTIVVAPGTYIGAIQTVRGGTAAAPIRIKSATRRAAIITQPGNVVRIAHPYVILEGLVIDGQDGQGDIVNVATSGSFTTIDDCEIRNTRRDCVDMAGPSNVTISRSDIHDCLNATTAACASPECRVDAHGVVTGPVKDLVIRDTDIHDFSGDAFQADPGRSNPGWDNVTIERCRMWLAPLPKARNGFVAGVVPGENAVDTKTPATGRARLVVRDSVAYGFGGGLISNMAAFNIKERVDAVIDRVTVHDSEIAFRLRGPSVSIVQNAIVHAVAVGVRYEDDTTPLTLRHVTFGRDVARALTEASSDGTTIDARNVLFLGVALPSALAGMTNVPVAATAFVDASKDDYRLAPGSPAIDQGEVIASVVADRGGLARVQGKAPDIGAHEACDGPCVKGPEPDGSTGGSGGNPGGEGSPPGDAAGGPDVSGASSAGGDPEGAQEGGCALAPSPVTSRWSALLVSSALAALFALRMRASRRANGCGLEEGTRS